MQPHIMTKDWSKTNGGRVLSIVASGDNLLNCRDKVYEVAEKN